MTAPPPHVYLNPCNTLTYLSLLAGLAAVAASAQSSWNAAWAFVGMSVLLDTFDGRFAGAFERTEDEKAFGVQLDSLVDGTVFGLVPPVCLLLLSEVGNSIPGFAAWLLVSSLFVTASLTRLGCYNIHQATGDHFVGMPTTVAALILCSGAAFTRSFPALLVLFAICAALMVVRVSVPRPRGWRMLLFVAWIVSALSFHAISSVLPAKG